MGRRTTKPNSDNIAEDFNFDKFVKSCVFNKYVLVVGPEIILNLESSDQSIREANGNCSNLLLHATIDHYKEKGNHLQNIEDFTQITNSDLHSEVSKVVKEEWNFEENFNDEFEPSLFKLLKTRCFPLVLTTTIDPYIEIAMRKVWGDKLHVLDFYDEDKKKKDIDSKVQKLNEYDESAPTLYYLFGKANSGNGFVLTEEDKMKIIRNYFLRDQSLELLKHIRQKRIVTIGCKFDNWLYRFFWFILRGNLEIPELGGSSFQVAVEYDSSATNFLSRYRIERYKDARDFMCKTTEKLDEQYNEIIQSRTVGGIFISYAHEDIHLALAIFSKLKEKEFDVWLDENKLDGGAIYEQRIYNAINQCTCYLPLLTSQVAYDLENNNTGRFYIKTEWNAAQQKVSSQNHLQTEHPMKVIPIIASGYDIRSDYHQKTPDCIKNHTVYDASKESIDKLIQLIKKDEKKE